MSDWLTYSLGDFLLFSPRTYYRLFELYNAAIWPAQLIAFAAGLALLALPWLGGRHRGRVAAAILALCWAWVAWGFLYQRYQTINWAAVWIAAAFGVQAVLLAAAVATDRLAPQRPQDLRSGAGYALLAWAVLLQPLLAPLLGRSWRQAELFGTTPDPTVVATLGILLLIRPQVWPVTAALLPIPLLWCAFGGATLWAMRAPDAPVMPAAAVLALLLLLPRPVRGA